MKAKSVSFSISAPNAIGYILNLTMISATIFSRQGPVYKHLLNEVPLEFLADGLILCVPLWLLYLHESLGDVEGT